MAKLYISEYAVMAKAMGESISIAAPQEPSITDQTPVVIGATSLQSSAFNAATRVIRVHTDAICSIAISGNPTATADKKRLAAGATEYFGVTPGHKLAVITNS